MVYRAISEDLKVRALYLLDKGYITEEVCELMGVSRRSLYRWKANQLDYDGVIPPANPLRGRPRILNPDQTHDLLTLLAEAPELYLDEIMDWVALYLDASISRTALHTLINDAGLTYKILRRAASERDEEAREEWRQLIRTTFIDADFVRGLRYSIVAAITIDGYIGTRIVSGSVDGDEFFDFIVNDILPQMNSYPNDRSVLILDNCAIHKSEYLREVVEAQGFSFLSHLVMLLMCYRLCSSLSSAIFTRFQSN
ncbi:hypothetical protein B0H12DRAFT_1176342 [Mycena haematopus]|nr:hypothetical protein B0H12DRAFT_1304475 [Mycena haematopus]KAJ7274473.1 hypothetical protein B0H12DRAFT_1176342 [Mycena haematopus]